MSIELKLGDSILIETTRGDLSSAFVQSIEEARVIQISPKGFIKLGFRDHREKWFTAEAVAKNLLEVLPPKDEVNS